MIPTSGVFTTPTYYITDEADSGDSHIADYRQTLTTLNAEYLTTLTRWAHTIGMQSSTQVAYNLPMDMLANIPDVDAPKLRLLDSHTTLMLIDNSLVLQISPVSL